MDEIIHHYVTIVQVVLFGMVQVVWLQKIDVNCQIGLHGMKYLLPIQIIHHNDLRLWIEVFEEHRLVIDDGTINCEIIIDSHQTILVWVLVPQSLLIQHDIDLVIRIVAELISQQRMIGLLIGYEMEIGIYGEEIAIVIVIISE